MRKRTRTIYTATEKALMWERWQKGDCLNTIARLFDTSHSAISNIVYENGGIRPAQRKRSSTALTLDEREEISRVGIPVNLISHSGALDHLHLVTIESGY
ncbi:hypothetical protein LCGC14_2293820 [marine sediment metagenome]|uniref:Transposase IS30-like HTH domain-containing protein n=1 Tax=marine sediment metagenome TaxID=412755 RepID=A0A0F9F2Y2_9ZZZZ